MRLPQGDAPHFLCVVSFTLPRAGRGEVRGKARDSLPWGFQTETALPPRGSGRVTHDSQRTGTLPPLPPPTAHTQREGRRLQPLPPALFIFLTAGTARAPPPPFSPPEPRDRHRNRLRGGGGGGRAQVFPGALSGEDRAGEGSKGRGEKPEERGWPLSRFPSPKRGLVRMPNDWQSESGLGKGKGKGRHGGRRLARVSERKARPRGSGAPKHPADCC